MNPNSFLKFDLPKVDIALKHTDSYSISQLGFKVIKVLNKGTFSVVFVVQSKSNRLYAMKKLYFPDDQFGKVVYLINMKRHQNLIAIKELFIEETQVGNGKICFELYDLYDLDLEQLIFIFKQKNLIFPPKFISHIMVSLLKAVVELHGQGIIHRDIKPSNIFLKFKNRQNFTNLEEKLAVSLNDLQNDSVQVVLGDLGHVLLPNEQKLSSYVGSRSYRAPELFFGFFNYSTAIDIWAIACVIAEMFRLKPLFSGENSTVVLAKILEVTGGLTASLNERYTGNFESLEVPSLRPSLKEKISKADERSFELINKMLNVDDESRLTASQCLQAWLILRNGIKSF